MCRLKTRLAVWLLLVAAAPAWGLGHRPCAHCPPAPEFGPHPYGPFGDWYGWGAPLPGTPTVWAPWDVWGTPAPGAPPIAGHGWDVWGAPGPGTPPMPVAPMPPLPPPEFAPVPPHACTHP
jgi:hypothetical protein